MKTAAVILNYNDAQGTVDAVRRIDGFFCFDSIVVVDNASTDNSAVLIKEAVDKINAEHVSVSPSSDSTADETASDHRGGVSSANAAAGSNEHGKGTGKYENRIHFVASERNGGYGSGNNLGVRYAAEHCGAKLAVIANPDAEFDEELILAMQQVFEHYANAAVVGAVMLDAASGSRDSGEFSYDEYTASGWKRRGIAGCVINGCPLLRRVFKTRINYPQEYYDVYRGVKIPSVKLRKCRKYIGIGSQVTEDAHAVIEHGSNACAAEGDALREKTDAVEVYAVHGSLLMVSADKFIKLGGYDEHMFLYCEENTLAEKIYRRGLKSFLLKQGYKHAGSVSITGSGLKAAARQRIRNASERYYYEHYLGGGKAAMLAVNLMQSVVMLETYMAAMLHLI